MEISLSALVPYPVDSMFDLIERAESYPQFLPWCTSATILERSDDWVAARLEFSYLKLRFGFQTRNSKCRPEWLQVRLVEGPFRRFEGHWRLTPLGGIGCKVEFALSYELAAKLLEHVALPAVEHVSRSMIDAFVRRAEKTLAVETASASAKASPPAPDPIESAVAQPIPSRTP